MVCAANGGMKGGDVHYLLVHWGAEAGCDMDRRVLRTYRALNEAFTALLAEYSYERVTVAMLCERASIRRTTFYKHFTDKADFLTFFVNSLRVEFAERAHRLASGADSDGAPEHLIILEQLADFLLEHEALFDNVFESSASGTLLRAISDGVARSISELVRGRAGTQPRADGDGPCRCEFAAGGVVRLLQLWWEQGHTSEGRRQLISSADALTATLLRA